MPQQRFGGELLHPDPASIAVAYLFHITQSHPFHDGNKRTGVLAALVFLTTNGIEGLPASDEPEETTMAVASSRMAKQELTTWLRERIG